MPPLPLPPPAPLPPPLPAQIGTWTPKSQPAPAAPGSSGSSASSGAGYRRSWGITVKKGDPAFIWAQWLAPIYSIGIAKVEMALRQEVGPGCWDLLDSGGIWEELGR